VLIKLNQPDLAEEYHQSNKKRKAGGVNMGQFGMVEEVKITILVDNRADLIVESNETVKFFTESPLLAEHGFSALVHLPGPDLKILWDAGVTRVALSHGHHDHFAALADFLSAMNLKVESKEWAEPVTSAEIDAWLDARRVPVIAHPAAFRERWRVKKDGTKVGPFVPPPRLEWESLGAKIELSEGPYRLGPGCWTTGYIPRKSFEKSGRPTQLVYRQGEKFYPDDLEEDQAIVLHIRGKGLIVLSGCAHSGIINTVNYARDISGVDRVWAIIGGFHLARSSEEEIQHTIASVKTFQPEIVVPCHCTGFQAMSAFSRQMPGEFIPGVVGATYPF
jgi:7,8-dihydropterin-6-yl-methyl-4-(beta-D-ribofuranosyl)aminobenzene 5'-phosphate synthase